MTARIEAVQVTENAATTSLAVALPAGVRAGEVLVNFLGVSGGTSALPAGWVRAAANAGTAAVSYFDYRVVQVPGLEPASYTWSGFTSGRASGIMARVSGADTTNPIDVVPTIGTNTGVGATCVCGAQTPVTPGTFLLSGICGNAAVGLTWTPPAGFSLAAQSTGTGRGSALASATGPAVNVSTGTETWSWSSTNLELRGLVIAVRDALVYDTRPYHAFQLSFSDPNVDQIASPPVWVNFTQYLRSASGLMRGRNYELGQTFPLAPTALLRDVNEYLNSENGSSPYAPNVKPYRSVVWQAMWPNLGLGNLINTGAWCGNKLAAIDPTFDSYAVDSRPWWTAPTAANTNLVVKNFFAHSGTKALYMPLNTLAGQGIDIYAAAIPGQVYTASWWVMQETTTNTVQISTTYGATGGTPSTITGSIGVFSRQTITFTATQPYVVISLRVTNATPTAGNLYLDDVQLELGVNASTFTSTGPVIYPIIRGYAERFTKQWLDGGFTGYVQVPLVDSFAALTATRIGPDYSEALMTTAPDFYWTLNGGNTTLAFPDSSGHSGPPLGPVISKYGPGSGISAGSSLAFGGDAAANGVAFNAPSPNTGFNEPATIVGTGWPAAYGPVTRVNFPLLTTPTSDWSVTVSAVFELPAGSLPAGRSVAIFNSFAYGVFSANAMQVGISDTSGVFAQAGTPSNGNYTAQAGAANTYADGLPHLVVATFAVVSGTMTINLYVDGVLKGTVTQAGMGAFVQPTTVDVGGLLLPPAVSGFTSGGIFPGVIGRVALWRRVLSGGEITTLKTAFAGYVGETTGTRLLRHLGNGGYVANTGAFGNVRISTGETTLGPPTFSTAIDMLNDAQNLTTAEQGTLWTAPDGALVFEDRYDRFLRLTSTLTLGESQAGGETPYEQSIQTDIDPQYAFADVEITRNTGATGVGGLAADINTAIASFFNRSYSAAGDFQYDYQAQDMANWIFYTHNAATQRIAELVLNPAALTNASLATPHSVPVAWPVAFGIEVGDRITVKQRMPAANAGAGLTLSADFFVESVEHDNIDMDSGTWETRLTLSPLNLGKPQSVQPWLLGDATYGVLDTTTKLGF